MEQRISKYLALIKSSFTFENVNVIDQLADVLHEAWLRKRYVYICGNGGSSGNAMHLANDLNYGIDKKSGIGLKVEALSANASVLTCIANDEGYQEVFAQQLRVKAEPKDILIVLSGSGNSPNILNALETANQIGMKTFALLGFDGGKAKAIAKKSVHFPVEDMQISENLQLIVGHILVQALRDKGRIREGAIP